VLDRVTEAVVATPEWWPCSADGTKALAVVPVGSFRGVDVGRLYNVCSQGQAITVCAHPQQVVQRRNPVRVALGTRSLRLYAVGNELCCEKGQNNQNNNHYYLPC